MASARSWGSPGETRRPVTPSWMTSPTEPTGVAMQGRPAVMASRSESGRPSLREGSTKRSNAEMSAEIWGRLPGRWTHPVNPAEATSSSMSLRMGPSPTMTSRSDFSWASTIRKALTRLTWSFSGANRPTVPIRVSPWDMFRRDRSGTEGISAPAGSSTPLWMSCSFELTDGQEKVRLSATRPPTATMRSNPRKTRLARSL